MVIQNASVYGEDGAFHSGDIHISGDHIVTPAECDEMNLVLDGSDCYAVPGLIDIHFHGCAGYDLGDGTVEALERLAQYEASVGVTGIVPATMTLEEERLFEICRAASAYAEMTGPGDRAAFYGIHMEGPFISAAKKGAQDGAHIRLPDVKLFDSLQETCGHRIRLVDIAPETEGAMEFIEAVCKKAICDKTVVSLAHTAADYDISMKAFAAGASHVTHLYQAMTGFHHRAPGIIGAAADSGSVTVELICDGIHVHPAAVRTAFKIFGDDRIILISDSMRATGMGDGKYDLGGQKVNVTGSLAALRDGTIAGSVTDLADCLRTAVLRMGIPLESAVKCATANPAKRIGIYERCGSISPSKLANIVLLRKEDLSLRQVILKGVAI
ncbi:MAG: N-acetylglucosamine-6-phosphate deacetylase [Clostridium sp.]|nr:N-acetylglucosamine-6-phosphate deacetylase [Acetatifactor muris]MCM1526549.1 N-acetylglucosamine-6-phosphate deacetylase [Bacteroides sp.]MCM1562325.1 N-acetylglucosamine-6-phosphate deacetylase [Clostridium sp.]